jgi:hypothetical protein
VPTEITVRVDWSDLEALPTHHVNQVIGQVGPAQDGIPDGIYVSFGSVTPPIVLAADEDEHRAIVRGLQHQPAKVTAFGRFHLSRESAAALVRIVQTSIAQYDAAAAGQASGHQSPEVEAIP